MDSILSFTLNNLATIISQEATLLGGLKGELQGIKDELEQMRAFLKRAEFLVENDPSLKVWAGQVRDVAYDIEDVLDEFILRCTHRYSYGIRGQVRKIKTTISTLKARHEIASEIKKIKNRITSISEAHKRYQTQYGGAADSTGSSSYVMRNTLYDRRGDALLLKESDLVGIEDSKTELKVKLLSEDVRRNVISVVGMGGLGKTTLVKNVYDDVNVRNCFTHMMWITVSESFKLEELLKATIRRLFKEQNRYMSREELQDLDVDGLKQLILELLESEKYLVVYDDVWSQADWDAIHLAFPRNKCGSRVLITTRNLELGQAASNTEDGGFVYPLKPLGEEEASQLFCKTTFGDSTSCPHHLKHVCQKILRACEGLPLAIVVIGSTLATKCPKTEEWDLFYRSMGEVCESNKKMNVMMRLLSLSYYDLPDHLRICLLYLSMFPEDAFIQKNPLVRLWVAEGLVQPIQGMVVEEVGESYLNELLSRSLVQVAEFHEDGRVKAVRVHDIVRLIILLKANDQNITTIIDTKGLQCRPAKVRRLAIHGTVGNINELGCTCKSLRSLVLYDSRDSISKSALKSLLHNGQRLLKVLDLNDASLDEIPNQIFTLLHLKYLSLRNTKVTSIPKSIGKLQNLETLDLQYSYVSELPIEILKLQKLRHILVYFYKPISHLAPFDTISGFRAPYKIGDLKHLQKLDLIEADGIGEMKIVKEIGKLTQLRTLGVSKLRREDGKELCSSLGKLTQLCSLTVVSFEEEEVLDLQYRLSSNLPFLHTLVMVGRLEKIPQWISSLQGLTWILLRSSRLGSDPLQYLQDLPNLVHLDLSCAYEGEELCFKAGGFPKLKKLILRWLPELRRLIVEESSMPVLEQLQLLNCKSMAEFPVGMHHLLRLQRLLFTDMPAKFTNKLENIDKGSKDHQWILQVSSVLIRNYVDGRWRYRSLNPITMKFV